MAMQRLPAQGVRAQSALQGKHTLHGMLRPALKKEVRIETMVFLARPAAVALHVPFFP